MDQISDPNKFFGQTAIKKGCFLTERATFCLFFTTWKLSLKLFLFYLFVLLDISFMMVVVEVLVVVTFDEKG